MNMSVLHPEELDLQKYADGDLLGEERAAIGSHLLACEVCREAVAFVQRLKAVAAEMEDPTPPPHVLGKIFAERAAEATGGGEGSSAPPRGVVPFPQRFRRGRVAWMAGAALVILGASTLLLHVGEAGAYASDLQLTPEKPRVGERVTVRYRPAGKLAAMEALRLRARYRTPANERYQRIDHQAVADLRPTGNGTFEGSFTLPDSVVYAVFSVESEGGGLVDHNYRRLWEVVIHGEDGRPLYESLQQRANDLLGRNWELATATVQSMVDHYPDRSSGWRQLVFFQAEILGPSEMDSVMAVHRGQFARLHEANASAESLTGDELGDMLWYARGVGDEERAEFWQTRIVKEVPTHSLALQERVQLLFREHWGDDEEILSQLESMWQEASHHTNKRGVGFEHLIRQGLDAAVRLGDAEGIEVWAKRHRLIRPEWNGHLAGRLGAIPGFRREGLALRQQGITELDAFRPEYRHLEESVEEYHRRVKGTSLQRAVWQLGEGLLAVGDTVAATKALERAAGLGWNVGAFETLAALRFAREDTTGALEMWSRSAVDPGAAEASASLARTSLGERFDEAAWDSLTQEAAEAMSHAVLEEAMVRYLDGSVRLKDMEGNRRSLEELAGNSVTLVIFWSRYCGFAIEALPEIISVRNEFEPQGIRVLTISENGPSAELEAFLKERASDLPLYHDYRNEGSRAFNAWGTPEYFLMDRQGRVRFEYTSLDKVRSQAAVLLDLVEG